VVLPGWISYGDYLRCGAMPRFLCAHLLRSCASFAAMGGPAVSATGLQVLCCDRPLLYPALTRKQAPAFLCEPARSKSNPTLAAAAACPPGDYSIYRSPMAKGLPAGAGSLQSCKRSDSVLRYQRKSQWLNLAMSPGLGNPAGNVLGLIAPSASSL